MAFDLVLDPILSPLEENLVDALTGSITDLDIPGGEVSLEIDLGHSSPTQLVSVRDDGTGADQVAGDGTIQFSLPLLYTDDNPTVTPFDVYNISVAAREQVLSGTDAVFVIDVSGSTFGSSRIDIDGDGFNDSILRAEIAAFKALNQDLIDRGLGDTSRVSISAYSSSGRLLDMDPVTIGIQTFTTPNADADGNGVRDVDQALDTLRSGGGTNFGAGLQQAITAIGNAGTPPGGGSVIFLSDGFGFGGVTESQTITGTFGQSLRAFGVGLGSSLNQLQRLDPNAERFTDIQDLLNLFSGAGSNVNQDSEAISVTVNNVAPAVVLDPTSPVGEGDSFTLTGMFTDPGVQDIFEVVVDWDDPNSVNDATFALSDVGSLSVGSLVSSSTDSSVLAVTGVDASTGKVNFSISHQYQDDGLVTIDVSVTDDDSGIGTASVQLEITDVTPTTPLIPNPQTDPLNVVNGSTSGNDGVTGTDADDFLQGLGGNDVLSGGEGSDFLDGGTGVDTAVYQMDPAGVTIDLSAGFATDGFGDTDGLANIENVIGSAFDDDITGDSGVNNLSGGDGDDILIGMGGNDFLVGGAGTDDLIGGSGADTFLYVSPAEGGDTIQDFEVGIDKIMIVGAVFPGLSSGGAPTAEQFFVGSSSSTASHRFGYDAATGDVLFDADGNGGAAQVIATLSGMPSFSSSDILVI